MLIMIHIYITLVIKGILLFILCRPLRVFQYFDSFGTELSCNIFKFHVLVKHICIYLWYISVKPKVITLFVNVCRLQVFILTNE